jgi:hypothetical protein
VKITVMDVWMGDGTAYVWFVEQSGHAMSGVAGSMLEALRDAGNNEQQARGWPGLEKLEIVKK